MDNVTRIGVEPLSERIAAMFRDDPEMPALTHSEAEALRLALPVMADVCQRWAAGSLDQLSSDTETGADLRQMICWTQQVCRIYAEMVDYGERADR